jgi:TPR repeat protein
MNRSTKRQKIYDVSEKDIKKTFESYKKTADLGDAGAMYNLAICYEDGDGVEYRNKINNLNCMKTKFRCVTFRYQI